MNLKKLETRYAKFGKTSDALALSVGCWLESALGGRPGALRKAEGILGEALTANPCCVPLLLMSVFVHIETEDFTGAGAKLTQVMRYRSYFRQTSPLYYGILIFLQALLEIRRDGGVRNAKKIRRQLDAVVNEHPGLYAASAMLYMEESDRKNAFADFLESHRRGCASPFLYAALWQFYGDGASPSDPLVYPFLHWGLAHGADLRPISRFADCVDPDFFADERSRQLIREYRHPELLRKACLYFMGERDFSAEAAQAYKEAADSQILIPFLPEYLIRAAGKNGLEDINRFTMEKYLESAGALPERDIGLTSFVYHLILTDEKLADFVKDKRREILRFGAYCLENGLQGRYVNSIYHFLAKSGSGADAGLASRAGKILKEVMFLFEVRFNDPQSRVTHLFVSEKERGETVRYPVKNGVALVRAVDWGFAYCCMSDEGVTDEVPVVVPMLENPGVGLLWSFFDEGERMFPLLARLGNEILESINAHEEYAPKKAIPVLTALIESGGMSRAMCHAVNAALGGIMYYEGRLDEALAYYGEADENCLDDCHLERMLAVFVSTGQWERAGRLIAGKSGAVPDRALFAAVKKIAQSGVKALYPVIAGPAYWLLLKNWYDKELLMLVLGHYAGSLEEWLELSRTLSAASLSAPGLDEMILKKSVMTRRPDEGSQRVFERTAKERPDDPLVAEYAYYCVYEMVLNSFKPSYETLLILEKLYERNNDWFLAVGLSHVYLGHGVTTFRSEAILGAALTEQEKLSVLFPVFQGCRDKTGDSAYINKHHAFMYRGLPGKDVRLCYSVDDDAEYRQKKMRYVRFGLYLCVIPHFYGENIAYYFSETRATGSVSTKEESVKNTGVYIDKDSGDPYFAINNAIVYEQMFRYDQAEKVIAEMLREKKSVNAKIIN